MSQKTTCPNCSAKLKIKPEHFGKTGRCKKCGCRFDILLPEGHGLDAAAPAVLLNKVSEPTINLSGTAVTPEIANALKRKPAGHAVDEADRGVPEQNEVRKDKPEKAQSSQEALPTVAAAQEIRLIPEATEPERAAVTRPVPRIARPGEGLLARTVYAGKAIDNEELKREELDSIVDWQIGDVILDIYTVKGILGEGGMGRVYRVHHKGWDTDLAVKSPKLEIVKRAGAEDFSREAETWVNLGIHPNIVSCYYVRILGGIPRIFAECVTGGSLAEWISGRRLYQGSPEAVLGRILDIAMQIARGLEYAHQHGVVHQDIKPANILMSDKGTAKITDFGLARSKALISALQIPSSSGMTVFDRAGAYTPQYASPEQVNGAAITKKSDLWNWTVTLVEMLVGGVAWKFGPVVGEFFVQLVSHGGADSSIPTLPKHLAALINTCLNSNPDDRPQDFSSAIEALSDVYWDVTGAPYRRVAPRTAVLNADSLNNRALSLLDLGKTPDALELWDQALALEPHHPEATYNRGLIRYRSGSMDDTLFLNEMEEMVQSHHGYWKAGYLLALAHMQLGRFLEAREALPALVTLKPDKKEIQEAFEVASDICFEVSP